MPEQSIDWQTWIAQRGSAALLYARQLTGNQQDAEDAVHEGFLRFWPHRTQARDRAALFFTCVRSAALDGRRKNARRKQREEDGRQRSPLFALDAGAQDVDRREEVERAIVEIPQDLREVVVLKIWGGLTFTQIGEALAESPNTVAGRYRQAMEKLAAFLSPEVKHER